MPGDHSDAAEIASAFSDPLRLAVLQRLIEGPATVSDIVEATGESQPKVSNHLSVLRERNLVTARRSGRQIVYRLRNPSVAQVVESLLALTGPAKGRPTAETPIALARTCYDHLAGKLGVALLDALVARGALKGAPSANGDLTLTDDAAEVFADLGVDTEERTRSRRRRAFACLDWTERRPHLGGALGAALLRRVVDEGWIVRDATSRAVHVTAKGKRALKRHLGVET